MTEKRRSRGRDVGQMLTRLVAEEYCYVTTIGRKSGQPHKIEIWFGLQQRTLYLLSGGGDTSDWVRNMRKNPQVSVRIGRQAFAGLARAVGDAGEERTARLLLAGKYEGWREGRRLSEWARTALPIAVDLEAQDPDG